MSAGVWVLQNQVFQPQRSELSREANTMWTEVRLSIEGLATGWVATAQSSRRARVLISAATPSHAASLNITYALPDASNRKTADNWRARQDSNLRPKLRSPVRGCFRASEEVPFPLKTIA